MATKYKIWIEIERIDNVDTDDEDYVDEECPISLGYRDTLEDAVELQKEINKKFGEI